MNTRNHIRLLLEHAEMNNQYRLQAKRLYNAIVKNINDIEYQWFEDTYHTNRGNVPIMGYQFNVKDQFPELDIDLNIRFENHYRESDAQALYDPKINCIDIPILEEFEVRPYMDGIRIDTSELAHHVHKQMTRNPDITKSYIALRFKQWISLETFTHEMIHYFDNIGGGAGSNVTSDNKDYIKYYSHGLETHAYVQEAITKLERNSRYKTVVQQPFDMFMSKFMSKTYFSKPFLEAYRIDKKMQRSIVRELYEYWESKQDA